MPGTKYRQEWQEKWDKLLGTMNDYELARKVGVAPTTVCYHRKLRDVPPFRHWAASNPMVKQAKGLRTRIKALALASHDDLNYSEIARECNVSREWVRRIIDDLVAEARARKPGKSRPRAA